MKKIYLTLLSITSLALSSQAFAEDAASSSNFTSAQKEEIQKIAGEYLSKNPEVVMEAMQAAREKQQKEEIENMQKAVAKHKEKIFKNPHLPVAGNLKGTQSLVVFADPYCGYCKKLHEELPAVIEANKNLKVLFVDLPVMGDDSVTAVKAMIAANNQGKYIPLQKLILASKGPLSEKKLIKKAKSLGMDGKKFEADLKSKETQDQVDQVHALAQDIGIHGTPVLIVNETAVSPGYVPTEELNKMISESAAPQTK